MLKNFLHQSYNDLLFLVLILLITVFWVLLGLKIVELPSEITGALIVTWTILIQYYFRKKKEESKS
jgi:hypothetical protein